MSAPAIIRESSLSKADISDDDVVAVRSQALRSPLINLLGFAELIAAGELTDDRRDVYIASLLREGGRLKALIDKAQALQRLESGHRNLELGPVDIGSLIQRAVAASGADDRAPIETHLPDQLPLVSADSEAMLEVLANFLSNARAFSPDGGTITVEARSVGDMVEVSIRDHGVGVEAQDLPKLFRKYYRAGNGVRRRVPGAGLGLTINKKIVEAHAGRVGAESKGLGKGACFTFTLPVVPQSTASGFVLIVEDDAAFASLMKAEFAILGLSTVRAADAETAEHMLMDTTPQAIVLDLVLPGRQGEAFLLGTGTGPGPRPPVVVMTAKDLNQAEISALELAGALAVLPKEAGAPQAAVALIAEALANDSVAG
jgi:CheY-like chemotaxis protein